MASYESLMYEILPHVPSCPAPSVMTAIRAQTREFFHEAECWIHTIDETTTAGTREVAISNLPANTRVAVPLEIYVDGKPISTANHRMMKLTFAEEYATKSGKVEFVMLADNSTDTLEFWPLPNDSYAVTGRVAVKPIRTATELPDAIMDEFADGIIAATLAKLFGQANTEWYDAKLSNKHTAMMYAEIEKARSRSRKENTSRLMVATYGGI